MHEDARRFPGGDSHGPPLVMEEMGWKMENHQGGKSRGGVEASPN